MTDVVKDDPAGDPPAGSQERPGLIDAVPVRHYGTWVMAVIVIIGALMFANMIIFNPAFDWPFVLEVMNQQTVIKGLLIGTLLLTLLTMIVGILGGVVLALMRLSSNPILKGVAWVYTWVFRSIPRYVLLVFLGAGMGAIFKDGIALGVPFDWKIIELLGLHGDWRFAHFDANTLFGGFLGAVVGLGASEAAYMSEIARSGILSVDQGQREAAQALGMNSRKTTWRIVLPQAMRVIVPPTGNETIAMMKDTSLIIGLGSLTTELFFQVQNIATRTFNIVPSYLAAILYYLIVTSILMIGQGYLERRFGRGFGSRAASAKDQAAIGLQAGGAH
ncbi:amino acid ABC transporter permease [Microlunatus soli]|uniref:Polar amino acid transport system permease protein n=1 Tax=Microlunatus soli TaxID=630515 RepID=A0A1H1MFZ6_9ACTN|nr:amino acid ABC transporter permease [Microlunatus soli]SDR85761.1 polar amino acid transport system permease protein [Microlunatus soli]